MNDQDKKRFKQALNDCMSLYSAPALTVDQLRTWFTGLVEFSIDEVESAINEYIKTGSESAPKDSEDLAVICRINRVTIKPRNPTPLSIEENKQHAEAAKQQAQTLTRQPKDGKQWARDLLSGKKISNNPEIALRHAKLALGMKLD